MLSADLWEAAGQHFLITCDRYSGFPWVDQLKTLNTKAVANKMLHRFRDYGFRPQSIRADNGPQFRTEFQEFCEELAQLADVLIRDVDDPLTLQVRN